MQRSLALLSRLAIALSLAAGFSASAAPVEFGVNSAAFSVGSGYGVDSSETSSPTLLDVLFSTAGFAAQNFSLDLPGSPAQTFLFGAIDFRETNAGGGIGVNETNDLGVTASLTFGGPSAGIYLLTGTGMAVTGSVSDSAVDYTLVWTPLDVDLGSDGQFRISFNDLSWTGADSQDLMATVTLLRAPVTSPNNDGSTGGTDPQPQNNVPEPSTALLLGGALAAVWRTRRNSRSDRT